VLGLPILLIFGYVRSLTNIPHLLITEIIGALIARYYCIIRFIGELFKLKMLTEGIMHDCVIRLLRARDEDSLECLCGLLRTIGRDLDNPKSKVG